MGNHIRSVFMAGLLIASADSASAQDYKWYGAFGVGPSFLSDVDVTQAGVGGSTEFDTGAAFSGAVGKVFNDFRGEAELFAGVNDISSLKAGGGSVSASGDVTALALMLNGYYDISTNSKWTPYIGGGVGFANVSINDFAAVGLFLADDDDTVFAYQLKAGIGYQFTPRIDGTLGYRYFGTADADFVDSSGAPFSTDGAQINAVEIGLRIRF